MLRFTLALITASLAGEEVARRIAAELRQLLSKEALRLGLIAPSDQTIVDVTPSQSANSDNTAIAPSEDHTAAKAPKTAADAKNASVTYAAQERPQGKLRRD